MRTWGYYGVAGAGLLLALAFLPCLRAMGRAARALRRGDLFLVAAVFIMISASTPWQFKTLMDEGVILGISKQMHTAREASVPTLSISAAGGDQRQTAGYVDKRPLLQPVLVALMHDLTGYRPINAILINVGVSLLFLLSAWYLGFQIAGVNGARASVLLWASVPLLSLAATGGGLELVSLTLVIDVTILAGSFLQSPTARRIGPLVLAALLLAQSRYESAIFLLPMLVVVVIGCVRSGEVFVPWLLVPAPLLVVPAVFTRLLASGSAWTWEVQERTGTADHFSLSYAPQNLRSALSFFADTSLRHSNSLLVFILGVGLAPLAFRQLRAMGRVGSGSRPAAIAVGLMAASAAVLVPVIMCYYWADFRDPAAARLALVLYFPLVLSAVLGVAWLGERMTIWVPVLSVCAVFAVLWTSAVLAQKRVDEVARDTNQWNWLAGRIQSSSRSTLWVMPASVWPIVHGRDAMPLDFANAAPDRLQQILGQRDYQDVYFVEVFRVMMPNAELIQTDRSKTSPRFVLETVAEFSGQPFWVQRVSRLKEVRP